MSRSKRNNYVHPTTVDYAVAGRALGVSMGNQSVQIAAAQKGVWPAFRAAFLAVPGHSREDWATNFVSGFQSVKGAKDAKTRKLMMMASDYVKTSQTGELLDCEMPEAQAEAILWCRGEDSKREATADELTAMAVKFLLAAKERGGTKASIAKALKDAGIV